MGPRAGLDGKSRSHRDSMPDCPARSSVAIPTELPGPLLSEGGGTYSFAAPLKHRLVMVGPLPKDLCVVSKETVTSCVSPAYCWVGRR